MRKHLTVYYNPTTTLNSIIPHQYKQSSKSTLNSQKQSASTTLPKYFLWCALDLFVGNYSRLKILLGLSIVGSGYRVGLSGSFEQPIRTQARNQLSLAAVRIAGVLRPVDAQQAQGKAEWDPDHHRAERADDRNKRRESHGGGPRSHPQPKQHSSYRRFNKPRSGPPLRDWWSAPHRVCAQHLYSHSTSVGDGEVEENMKLARRKMFAGFSYVSVVSARAWLLPPLPSRGGSTFQAVLLLLLARLGAEGYRKARRKLYTFACRHNPDTEIFSGTLFVLHFSYINGSVFVCVYC